MCSLMNPFKMRIKSANIYGGSKWGPLIEIEHRYNANKKNGSTFNNKDNPHNMHMSNVKNETINGISCVDIFRRVILKNKYLAL